MAVVANSTVLSASFNWELEKSNTGFATTTHKGSFASKPTVNTTTYNEVYLEQFTLAASGTATKNLNSFTDLAGTSVTATKLLGYVVKATATVTGGILKVEDGAADPLGFALSGTAPAISLTVGTAGATLVLLQGTTHTVSSTAKNLKFTNSGTQSITVTLGAVVGT